MKATLIKEAGGYDLYRIDEDGKRVTFASTQDYKQKLSLKNCQAIEKGYDLDELLDNITPKDGTTGNISQRIGFVKGFQKALEILGDKKFSEEDMKNIFAKTLENAPSTESHTRMISDVQYRHFVMDELYGRITKFLQQTEWDVEVEMEFNPINHASGLELTGNVLMDVAIQENYKPKLDADGYLILKRV